MPIDASIYNSLGVKPKSTADYLQEYNALDLQKQQMQQNAQGLEQGRAKLDEYQRGVQEQSTIRNALAGLPAGADDTARIQALKGTGLPGGFSQADTLQKGILAQQTAQADAKHKQAQAEKENFATAHGKLQVMLDLLGGVKDQASYSQALQRAASMGMDVSKEPPNYDPAFVANAAQQALKHKERLEQMARDRGYDRQVANDAESARHNRATEGIAGAHLGLARDAQAATVSKPFEVTGADGNPVLVQQDKAGNITPVEGYAPKQKPLKDIPPAVNAKIIEGRQSLSSIDSAIKAVRENPGAFGLVNALPGVERLRQGDLKGVDARAQVANLGSLKLHDRSGAAVSASEFPRLAPFIPNSSDSSEAIVTKLKKFREIAEGELGLFADTYNPDNGYRAQVSKQKAPVGVARAPGAADDIHKQAEAILRGSK